MNGYMMQFPARRKYPIAIATMLMYLAWHPLGDFVESLIIGWDIVPDELFRSNWWVWWVPGANGITHSYVFAFFGYFFHVTALALVWYFLYRKYEWNKYAVLLILVALFAFFVVPFAFFPEHSVAYKNDIEGFKGRNVEPLAAWMSFHVGFWFVWMVSPHILGLFTTERQMLKLSGVVWFVFVVVWVSSLFLGRIVYVPVGS